MNDSDLPAPVNPLDDFFANLRALGYAVNEAWQDFLNFLQPAARAVVQAIKNVVEACLAPPSIDHRKRSRPRNSRVQMVQAKRKRLNLDQHGLYPGLRSRKASYAFAQEVERWCEEKRDTYPIRRDFEHVPVRRRKKKARLRTGGIINSAGPILVNESGHKELVYFAPGAQIFPQLQHEHKESAWITVHLSTHVDNFQNEAHHG